LRKKASDGKPKGAYERAVGLLARREHSSRELTQKLRQRGVEPDEAEAAVTRLRREDYQSDRRFAEVLIRHRAAAGYGPRYIDAELRSHGLNPVELRDALAEHDWLEIARTLVRKRAKPGLKGKAERTRLAQFLARRGFAGSVIYTATGTEVSEDP
jgi:regulatory protein